MIPCSSNPELWFSTDDESIEIAQAGCSRCSASGACLQLALANDEHEGIWGGTTPLERLNDSFWLTDMPDPEPWHGQPSGYQVHGCRRDCCRNVHNAAVSEWRERAATGAAKIETPAEQMCLELT